MRLVLAVFTVLLSSLLVSGQTTPASVTVPITLDHNRIIIDARFPLPDGSMKRVRCWVDNGNPDMSITEELATKLGLPISAEPQAALAAQQRMTQPPNVIMIGGMAIHPTAVKEAHAILEREAVGPGLSAEITLPATVLRDYDVVVDYPNRELTIAAAGSTHFDGAPVKVFVNSQNGLIQVPSMIAGERYNLALDVGASFGFVSGELIARWHKAHPEWPEMTGAVGPANIWGLESEPHWEVLRLASLQYGGTALSNVGVASFPQDVMAWFEKRAGTETIGLIGANALLEYRVGIDYAHSTVYLQKTGTPITTAMDVVGLTLRPEPDERYTVIGVADYEGKPSVPEIKPGDVLIDIDKVPAKGGTMGQVWSLLSGSPGDERVLTLEREGKQFTVKATVHRFLESPSSGETKPAPPNPASR